MANPTNFNIYSWMDYDAPQITYGGTLSGNGSSDAVGNQIVSLLDTCLVGVSGTAYGSKAPAGWTKEFSGSDYHVYKQGANSSGAYLQVQRIPADGNFNVRLDMFDTMTSITAGVGSVYGDSFSIKPRNCGWRIGSYSSGTYGAADHGIPWLIIANSAIFYFVKPGAYIGYNTGTGGIAYYIHKLTTVAVGDIISYDGKPTYILTAETYNATGGAYSDVQYLPPIQDGTYSWGQNVHLVSNCFSNRGNPPQIINYLNNQTAGDSPKHNNVYLISNGISTFSGDASSAPDYPCSHPGPGGTKFIEKIYVARYNASSKYGGWTILGELPGIYRSMDSPILRGAGYYLDDYLFISGDEPGYTSLSNMNLLIKKDGDWYGSPDYLF